MNTLFIQNLILIKISYLYIDDLIFTNNNVSMIKYFKHSMKKKFEMIDLGLMTYFLDLEVIQDNKKKFHLIGKLYKEYSKKVFHEKLSPYRYTYRI